MGIADQTQSKGDLLRRIERLEKQIRELAAARSAEATTIGEGGLSIEDGGALEVRNKGQRTFAATSQGDVFLTGSVESQDYEEGVSGYHLDTEHAQVPNLNVLGALGAHRLSVSELYVGGEKVSGGGPTTGTTHFFPQWSRSFEGGGGIWENYGSETKWMYQGYVSGTHGNTRSAAGQFEHSGTGIQSALAGLTINSVALIFRVGHAYQSAGLDVVIGTHTWSSKPSHWNTSKASGNRWQKQNIKGGETQAITLPNSVGEDLRDGNIHGITFGPGPSNARRYYGYLYGAGSGDAPYLSINAT